MLKKVFGHFGVTTTNNILNQSHPTQNLVSVCLNKKKNLKKEVWNIVLLLKYYLLLENPPNFETLLWLVQLQLE